MRGSIGPLPTAGAGGDTTGMPDLFAASRAVNVARAAPLAARMRPRRLAEYAGQQHVVGPGKLLRRLIESDRLGSVILYGPPGVGKTTLAEIIAHETRRRFVELSATASGVKRLRTSSSMMMRLISPPSSAVGRMQMR